MKLLPHRIDQSESNSEFNLDSIHICPPKFAMIEKGTGWEKLLGSVKYKSYLSRLCWFIGFYNLPTWIGSVCDRKGYGEAISVMYQPQIWNVHNMRLRHRIVDQGLVHKSGEWTGQAEFSISTVYMIHVSYITWISGGQPRGHLQTHAQFFHPNKFENIRQT